MSFFDVKLPTAEIVECENNKGSWQRFWLLFFSFGSFTIILKKKGEHRLSGCYFGNSPKRISFCEDFSLLLLFIPIVEVSDQTQASVPNSGPRFIGYILYCNKAVSSSTISLEAFNCVVLQSTILPPNLYTLFHVTGKRLYLLFRKVFLV